MNSPKPDSPRSNGGNRSRLLALVVTVAFHALLVVMLVSLWMYPKVADDNDRTWPPVDSAEVLFGGEFVMIGDSPDAALADAPEASASDELSSPANELDAPADAGEPVAVPSPPLTSKQPSPAKTEPKPAPEKTGPTKAEIEAAEKARREEAERIAINSKVKFGKKGSGTDASGSSTAGSPNGNSSVGATSGVPGVNLKGRTIAQWTKPTGPLGTVTVKVRVNRQGVVTFAEYLSGTGNAASNAATRQSCVTAARQSRFSVSEEAPESQEGTITYNFK